MSGWAAAERATEFGLLAAMVDEPATLERVRERYAAWQEQLAAEAADPVQATVARLAADGLWLRTCSGSPRPRESCASRSWRACSRSPTAID